MFRSGLVLASGRIGVALLRFARNILLARLISVDDYGIASTFIVTLALLELVGDLALDRMLVQDRDGNDPRLMATLHTLSLARGLLFGGLLYLAAGPVALLFNQPTLTWAYELFAIVPVVRSLLHLDVIRVQRRLVFGTMIKVELISTGLSFLLLWPVSLWLGDFRVLLVLLLIEQVLRTLASHVLAQSPFELRLEAVFAWRAWRFGWPLMLAGMIGFFGMQGERIIVANRFTATDLGLFSAATTLALTPALIATQISQKFLLPLLAAVQDDAVRFERRSRMTLELLLGAGAALMFGFAYLGAPVFGLAFGPAMTGGAVYMLPLGLAAGLRLVRAGPTTVALARGHTVNQLLANLAALIALPVAIYVVVRGGSIAEMILIGAAGMLAASLVSLGLLRIWGRLDAPRRTAPALLLMMAMTGALAAKSMLAVPPLWLDGLAGALFLMTLASCSALRRTVLRRALQRVRTFRKPAE